MYEVTNVVVLGKGTLAIAVADWFFRSENYRLVKIVPVVPEPAWTDSLIEWARSHEISYVESGNYHDISDIGEMNSNSDLAISVFYNRIIRKWFIDKFPRILNVHNSPLPKYRGVAPINWALKNGERYHGVTIHELTTGIDEGPIVSQVTYSIYPEIDEVRDVYRRSLRFAFALFEETMPILHEIEPVPQDHASATYYSAEDADRLGDRSNWTRRESKG